MSTRPLKTLKTFKCKMGATENEIQCKIGDRICVVDGAGKNHCGFVVKLQKKNESKVNLTYTYRAKGIWNEKMITFEKGILQGDFKIKSIRDVDFEKTGNIINLRDNNSTRFVTGWQRRMKIEYNIENETQSVHTLLYTSTRAGFSVPVFGAAFFLGNTHVSIERCNAANTLTHQKRVVYLWTQYEMLKKQTLHKLKLKNVEGNCKEVTNMNEAEFLRTLTNFDFSKKSNTDHWCRRFWQCTGVMDENKTSKTTYVAQMIRAYRTDRRRARNKYNFTIENGNVASTPASTLRTPRFSTGSRTCNHTQVLECVQKLFGNEEHGDTMDMEELSSLYDASWQQRMSSTLKSKHLLRIVNALGIQNFIRSNPFEATIVALCGEIIFSDISKHNVESSENIFELISKTNTEMNMYVMLRYQSYESLLSCVSQTHKNVATTTHDSHLQTGARVCFTRVHLPLNYCAW